MRKPRLPSDAHLWVCKGVRTFYSTMIWLLIPTWGSEKLRYERTTFFRRPPVRFWMLGCYTNCITHDFANRMPSCVKKLLKTRMDSWSNYVVPEELTKCFVNVPVCTKQPTLRLFIISSTQREASLSPDESNKCLLTQSTLFFMKHWPGQWQNWCVLFLDHIEHPPTPPTCSLSLLL